MSERSVYLESLGCSKALVDSEAALGFLLGGGWRLETDPAAADLLLLNTCSFIEDAREQSVERILDLARIKGESGAQLAVVGCLPQRYADELREEIPEIDLLAGVGKQAELAEAIAGLFSKQSTDADALLPASPTISFAGFTDRPLLTPPHLAYVKIGEGCSRRCSFCAIPGIRGNFHSRRIDDIEIEARSLLERGVGELNLISQDTAFFGRERGGPELFELVKRLSTLDGLRWIRLFYLHPTLVELPELLELYSLPRVVPYLDMPIQHASNKMLSLMNRGHDVDRLRSLFGGLRREMPELSLRTTVLVGHPGEEDDDMAELQDFLAEHPFDHLGVFGYSPEEDTASPGLGPAPAAELVAERMESVQVAQMGHSESRAAEWVGRRLPAVVEALAGQGDGMAPDRSLDPLSSSPFPDARVALRTARDAYEVDGHLFLDEAAGLSLGQWVEVEVTDSDVYDLAGKLKTTSLP
jgi:ribosomal protein S12 methylthiotransferase